jgi:UDP-N-acetylglucosamine:LPS N-acetylglucosamine transferase
MVSLHKQGIEVLCTHISKDDVVIVAPLNWGLGHATRCVPLIDYLLSRGTKVIIASDGLSLKLLQKEFPQLQTYELPSYGIRYKHHNMALNMVLQGPSLAKAYLEELKVAKKIVSETIATVIVSDNRFGFRTPSTKNYYITHQVNILHPIHFISKLASRLHKYIIDKFDQCWIPDFASDGKLAGNLSVSTHLKHAVYLGPLTRIENKKSSLKWDICILLSGPEPQRTILENVLIEIAPSWGQKKILWIRGTENKNPNIKSISHQSNIINLGNTIEIADALQSSHLLIARSGYTTVMDIAQLDIKAIFIPTPGQTEQEYLARALIHNPKYTWVAQSDIQNIKI